jgi:hypothetical protein
VRRTSSGLVCWSFGRSWWESEHYLESATVYGHGFVEGGYLECAAETEDTVVGLLRREALEGCEDSLGLFGDQIIGSVQTYELATTHLLNIAIIDRSAAIALISGIAGSKSLPQAELSVARGIGVPIGNWSEHLAERWARLDERGQ